LSELMPVGRLNPTKRSELVPDSSLTTARSPSPSVRTPY
jgi:hypothetical protein